MADTPIDKLIFALGGDVSALNDAYKQAEAGAAKTGTTIQQNLGKGFKDAAASAASDGKKLQDALGGVGEHARKMTEHIQVSRREMIYFFRELANGDIQRLPATMALFLSHLLEVSPAALAATAAIAAIPLAVTVAAVKADEALAKIRTSLALTAYASGASTSAIAAMASAAVDQAPISGLGARRIAGGLAGAGMPAGLMQQGIVAAGRYELGAGVSQEEATRLVGEMYNNPAKSATALNESMRLLNYAQTQQVADLQAMGKDEEAAAIILKEFSARSKEAAEQAGMWTKMLNAMGNAMGNFGVFIAHQAGTGSAQERLENLQSPSFGARFMRGLVETIPGAGGIMRSNIERQEADLKFQAAEEDAAAKRKGQAARDNELLSRSWAEASKGSNEFVMRLDALKNNMLLAGAAAKTAKEDFLQGRGVVTKQGDIAVFQRQADVAKSVYEATARYGDPVAEARRRAANARELAAAPLENQAYVAARQSAYESYYRNLQNPQLNAQAKTILGYDLQAAQANRTDANRAKEQAQRLKDLELEAKGAKQMADAYDVSRAAVSRAKVEAEVDVEVTNRQIAAKDRLAAVNMKLAIAFDQARQKLGELVETQGYEAEASAIAAAAGGSPAEQAAAKRRADVQRQIAPLLSTASSPEQRAQIEAGGKKLQTDADVKAQNDAIAALKGNVFNSQQNLAFQRQYAGAEASGMSEDNLRRLKVYQNTLQDVQRLGIDPSLPKYQAYVQSLVQANEAMSDLQDAMQKAGEEAKGLADDITQGLDNMLHSTGKDWQQKAAEMGGSILDTLVKSNVLEPMNKWLTSQFSGLIGGPGELGSSTSNPMYVMPVGPGGVPLGLPGGGGGLGGLLGGPPVGSITGNPIADANIAQRLSGGESSAIPGQGGIFGNWGYGGLGKGGSLLGNLFTNDAGTGMFDTGNFFGSGGAVDQFFGGTAAGVSTTGISSAFADSAVAADASALDLSSLSSTLPDIIPMAKGGPLSASSYYLVGENGPELLGPGVAGVITPNSAPSVQAALGSRLSGGGDSFHFGDINLPNVKNPEGFIGAIKSKSQLARAVTQAASHGRRNG